MKNAILLIGLLCLSATTYAQEHQIGGLTISKLNISIGSDQDMLRGMNYSYFADQVPLTEEFQFRDNTFANEDITTGYCENHNYSIGFTLKHDKFEHLEWRNSVVVMEERGDGVSYENEKSFVQFSSTQDEYGLETMLLYRKPIGKGFVAYVGGGTNMGLSVNNRICVNGQGLFEKESPGSDGAIETEYENINACYEASNMFNQRLVAEYGIAWGFKDKYEIGLNFRKGLGYRLGSGGATGTQLEGGNISFAYYYNN